MRLLNLPLSVIELKNKWIACTLAFTLLLIPSFIFAQQTQLFKTDTQDIDFEVSPNRCVTLRQGQPCYARVRFNWRSKKALAACIYILDGAKITCWKSSDTGSIVLTQTLPNTTEYILVDACLLYTSPSPRDKRQSRMPSSA